MPKYYGSRQDVHTPFMRAPRMEHTPDQINAWWDTLAQGAHDDLHISRDLNREPAALYFLNDNGVLTPAVRSGDDLGSPAVRGRLLDQSRAGRLFVRGLGDDYPRQIITDENYNAGITAPTNTLPAVEGNPPPKPRRPALFKYVLALFMDSYKEEINTYNARKERYDQSMQRREMVQNFRENVKKVMKESIAREAQDPDIASRKEAQEKALKEAWEQKKAQQAAATKAAEEEWMKNPSEETLPTFENHLRDMYITDFAGAAQRVLARKGTVGEYCTALAQMLEQQVAIPLLEKADDCKTAAAKDALLLQQQNNYIKMMKNLKLFVPTQINMERLQAFLQTETPTFEQTQELHQEIRDLAANGMQKYQQFNPKPEAGKEPPKPEVQMQQPQAEQAPQLPPV